MDLTLTKLAEAIQEGMRAKLAQVPTEAIPGLLSGLNGDAMKNLLLGGAIASPVAYLAAKHFAKQKQNEVRNKSFGAGMATGLAAPSIVSGLNRRLNPYG